MKFFLNAEHLGIPAYTLLEYLEREKMFVIERASKKIPLNMDDIKSSNTRGFPLTTELIPKLSFLRDEETSCLAFYRSSNFPCMSSETLIMLSNSKLSFSGESGIVLPNITVSFFKWAKGGMTLICLNNPEGATWNQSLNCFRGDFSGVMRDFVRADTVPDSDSLTFRLSLRDVVYIPDYPELIFLRLNLYHRSISPIPSDVTRGKLDTFVRQNIAQLRAFMIEHYHPSELNSSETSVGRIEEE